MRCQTETETVEDLREMIEERLRYFIDKSKNKEGPSKIVVYRAGVADTLYQKILDEEYPKIKAARDNVCTEEPKAPISLIIVGKPNLTSFLPMKATNELMHVSQPGSIVDRVNVTEKEGQPYDFLLQTVRAGKMKNVSHLTFHSLRIYLIIPPQSKPPHYFAKPAHYIVIKDEANHTPKAMEEMTNNLCYLSGRSTGAVSICPPAFYADLICQRGRCFQSWAGGKTFGGVKEVPWKGGVHKSYVTQACDWSWLGCLDCDANVRAGSRIRCFTSEFGVEKAMEMRLEWIG